MKFVFYATVLLLLGCNPSSNNTEDLPILIGEFGSLSGREASFGQSTNKGIKLAISEINASGGIKGRPLQVITKDNKSRSDLTQQIVSELIEKHNVLALLGEVASSRSLLAAPIAQRSHVPMLSPSSSNPRVTEVGNFIFRACYVDPFQGEVMANFAFKDLKIRRVAVLKDKESDYSQGLSNYFIETFRKLGGVVIADESYKSGDIDFKNQLSFIKTEKPEALFIPGYYTEVALIAKQIKKMGLKTQLLGGDGWDSPRLFEIARDSVNGAYFTNHFAIDSDIPKSKKFVNSFRKKFKKTPDGVAAMAYDATHILATALRNSKEITRERLRDQLSRIKDYPGVTGSITIDQFRNGIKPSVIVKVDGPIQKFVTTVAPNKEVE